jgi:hypothetical protein
MFAMVAKTPSLTTAFEILATNRVDPRRMRRLLWLPENGDHDGHVSFAS